MDVKWNSWSKVLIQLMFEMKGKRHPTHIIKAVVHILYVYIFPAPRIVATALNMWENNDIFTILMYKNKRSKTFCIVINNVLSIVINIQNTTIFEPLILTGFHTSSIMKAMHQK